jgi:hypothetical protein
LALFKILAVKGGYGPVEEGEREKVMLQPSLGLPVGEVTMHGEIRGAILEIL